jgi:hypothetical protein
MKHILILLILLVAFNQGSGTKKESDREHDEFVGTVKKVFVWWSPISGWSYPADSRCRQMTKVYDESGRLMQHSVYPGACGSDEIRNEYSYASDGSRTEKSQEITGEGSPPPPPPPVGVGPTANANAADKGEPRMVFKYDPSSGKVSESTSIRPGGKIIFKLTYTYDNGRIIEVTGHESDGRVSSRRVYSYSGDEKVPSGFAYYDGKGNVYERTTYSDYKFNSQGDWISRKQVKEERSNRRGFP